MEKEANRLFKFATKELSQDAFLAWCINWVNYPDSKLYELGIEFMKMISTDKNKKAKFKVDKNTSVKIIRQYHDIDILAVVNKKYIIIIEDKTNSFNHNQLEVSNPINENEHKKDQIYKNKLINILSENEQVNKKGEINYIDKDKKQIEKVYEERNILGIEEFNKDNIIEVYIKTGVITDKDKEIMAIQIDAKRILEILEKYVNESDIIKDYYECIKFKTDLLDENRVSEIIKNNKIKLGTKLGTKLMCFKCFYNSTGNNYENGFKGHMYDQVHGYIDLNKARNVNLDANVKAWLPKMFKQKEWINEYNSVDGTIKEIVFDKNIEMSQEEFRYVFIRKLNEFSEEYFEFIGVFFFYKMQDIHTRVWKRIELGEEITLDINEVYKRIREKQKN